MKPKAEDRANSDVNAAAVWPEVEQANNATYAAENDPRYTQLAQIIEQARTRHERGVLYIKLCTENTVKSLYSQNLLPLSCADSLQESRKQQREAGAARSSQRRSGAAGDEDVTMGQEEGPRVCPITKRAPEQPVRNRLCGHVYDRAGVEHYMRGSRNPTCVNPQSSLRPSYILCNCETAGFGVSCRCPMTGCMNRKRLEPEQLEDVEQSGACATDTPHRA